jgi:hypothetical protein
MGRRLLQCRGRQYYLRRKCKEGMKNTKKIKYLLFFVNGMVKLLTERLSWEASNEVCSRQVVDYCRRLSDYWYCWNCSWPSSVRISKSCGWEGGWKRASYRKMYEFDDHRMGWVDFNFASVLYLIDLHVVVVASVDGNLELKLDHDLADCSRKYYKEEEHK